MEKRIKCGVTPAYVNRLGYNDVFVFGSNLQGHHAGGAAATAMRQFGAQWGVGVGMTGQCYAIPTMHGGIDAIRPYVSQFINYAIANPHKHFLVTRIGCGIAGFNDIEIAPLFAEALYLTNVSLPAQFINALIRWQ